MNESSNHERKGLVGRSTTAIITTVATAAKHLSNGTIGCHKTKRRTTVIILFLCLSKTIGSMKANLSLPTRGKRSEGNMIGEK